MQFDSAAYLLLLTVTFAFFHLGPARGRVLVLLAASLIFYGSWSVPFLLLVFYSAILDFVAAQRIEGAGDDRGRRRWLVISLVSNLSVLGVFKYANFIRETLHVVVPDVAALASPWHIVLPIGISFYTFQTMSYSIDVYRGRIRAESDFIEFMLYVCFFPQLIAGPIERAGHLMPQIKAVRDYCLKRDDFHTGLLLLTWGLFKKAALADNLGRIVDVAYAHPQGHGGLDLLVATYAFAFQIFFDFSAYSDMARGAAALFGIKLVRNFNLPYLARDPSDFWRRWHISLSEWIRDYLYFALGGSRGTVARTLFNLMLAMALAGLWHGSAWHFVVWGLFHGALLVAYRLSSAPLGRLFRPCPETLLHGLQVFLMFHLACAGWVLFRASSLPDALLVFDRIGTWISAGLPGCDSSTMLVFLTLAATFAIMVWNERMRIFHRLAAQPIGYAAFIVLMLVLTAIFAPETASPFIYFQF